MKPTLARTFTSLPCLIWMLMLMPLEDVLAGFKPVNPDAILKDLYGAPCDCRGGNTLSQPHTHFKSVDCGTKTAFLGVFKNSGGLTQHWICVDKPKYLPPGSPCPKDCVYTDQMNIRCYSSYSECTNGSKSYFTARANLLLIGNAGGDWSIKPQIWGSTNKYSQASCTVPVGSLACWNKIAPIHVSDGGGPTDAVREVQVHE
ncbi:Envelope glycoprotein [Lemmus lemmus]